MSAAIRVASACAIFLICAPAFAKPFYCNGSDENSNHPLSPSRLPAEVKAWQTSGDADFAKYFVYVRDAFRKAQPMPECDVWDNACNERAQRGAGYNRALDAAIRPGKQSVNLTDLHNALRTPAPPAVGSYAQVQIHDTVTNETYVQFDVPCSITPTELEASDPDKANILYANYLIESYRPVKDWETLSNAVRHNAELHLSLIRDGLAMWPWELWLNGHFASDDISKPPSRNQWVALRPSAGLELAYPNQHEAEAHVRLGIEPIGFVHYIGKGDDKFRKWWGASFLVTVGSDDGAGLGGLIRYDNYWLGLTAHSGSGQVFVFVGLDLYQAFTAAKDKLKQ